MSTKICTKCKEPKTLDCFSKYKSAKDGLACCCKECISKKSKVYYKNNKEEIYEKKKVYYKNNKEEIYEKKKVYREKNRSMITEKAAIYYKNNRSMIIKQKKGYREKNRSMITEKWKVYQKEHKEEIDERGRKYREKNRSMITEKAAIYYKNNRSIVIERGRVYLNKRYKNDPMFRLKSCISSSLRKCIKKEQSTLKYLKQFGYTPEELRNHLENQFTDGMTWDNYGKWHLDHIKPKCLFDHSDEKQLIECWSLSNLQPLWAKDNLSKGCKYEEPT